MLRSKGDKHILVCTMNHAGLDALNAFVIYNSFLNFIGLLSAGMPHVHTPIFSIFSTHHFLIHCPAQPKTLLCKDC
jgi:hypothetical protein